MPTELRFRKTGAEIKAAASSKMAQIKSRLKRRHESLDEFLRDQNFVRSYLIRSSKSTYGRRPIPLVGDRYFERTHGRDSPTV